jgi:uncharacterized protein (DUF305 family)
MMADRSARGRLTEWPEVLKHADDSIRTQNAEIECMEAWLLVWYGIKSGGHMHH